MATFHKAAKTLIVAGCLQLTCGIIGVLSTFSTIGSALMLSSGAVIIHYLSTQV
jgi:hypothetical protein